MALGLSQVPLRFWMRIAWPFYGIVLVALVAVELLGAVLFTLVEKPLAQYSRRWEWDKLKIVDPV